MFLKMRAQLMLNTPDSNAVDTCGALNAFDIIL